MAVNVWRCREFSKLQSVAQPDAALNPTADKKRKIAVPVPHVVHVFLGIGTRGWDPVLKVFENSVKNVHGGVASCPVIKSQGARSTHNLSPSHKGFQYSFSMPWGVLGFEIRSMTALFFQEAF